MDKFEVAQLRQQAAELRSLHHHEGNPLVLANVWDAASARAVAKAGAAAIATSSLAVALSLGVEDRDSMGADAAFGAIARVASVVDLPVTADLEGGYGLEARELVHRLFEAGAVGCNLEDSDHHGDGVLVDAGRQAERIHNICAAAKLAGIEIVVNARVDVYLRQWADPADRFDEVLRRARGYIEAGAHCVYPIGMTGRTEIVEFVEALHAPVNIWLRPGAPSLAELREIGVARVSVAGSLQRAALEVIRTAAASLFEGEGSTFWSGRSSSG